MDDDRPNQDQSWEPEAAYPLPQWDAWTRRFATVVLALVGVYMLNLLLPVLELLIVSLLLAFILFVPTQAITRRTAIPYNLSVVIVYTVLSVVVVFVVIILIPSLAGGAVGLLNGSRQAYYDFRESLRTYRTEDGIVEVLGVELDFNDVILPIRGAILDIPVERPLTPRPGSQLSATMNWRALLNDLITFAGSLTPTLTATLAGIVNLLVQLVLVDFISFLILLEIPRAYDAFFDALPPRYHREYTLLINDIIQMWSAFINGQFIIGFLIGLATWLQLLLMGIPGAFPLASFAGIVSPIPVIGFPLAAIPLALISLFYGSTTLTNFSPGGLTLAVLVVNFLIQQLIWTRVRRHMLSYAEMPVAVIVTGMFVGLAFWGVLGVLLATPILATLQIVLAYIFKKLRGENPYPDKATSGALRDLLFIPVSRAGR